MYAIPLVGGGYGLAQAIAAMMENAIYTAVTSRLIEDPVGAAPAIGIDDVIALPAVVRPTLKEWVPREAGAPLVAQTAFPNERFRKVGYIGAKIYDAGVIADFLAAFHGRQPWNALADESYYDGLLAPGRSRPENVVLLSAAERLSVKSVH